MTELNFAIRHIPMPARMKHRPLSDTGFPIPWFVPVDQATGRAVMQAADSEKFSLALRQQRCWCCGERLGRYKAFVLGPMCVINGVTSEPPTHVDCAEYAVKACPFLANPRMRRNAKSLPPPEERTPQAGVALERNPGVAAIWVTHSYKVRLVSPETLADGTKVNRGRLIHPAPPISVRFYAHGRPATRQEIEVSVAGGLPALIAVAQLDGPESVRDLRQRVAEFQKLLPKAAAA